MVSVRSKKDPSQYVDVSKLLKTLYILFFLLFEVQKVIHFLLTTSIGYLLIWIPLATLVYSAPITFPSKTATNYFQMSPDGSYSFFYDTGPGEHQSFREEKRTKGGTISGSYGYVDPGGVLHITEYVADRKGYRASIEVYEPVHQIPAGLPLIVGPLPLDLRSNNNQVPKESVFDKYQYPIEPFESLKIVNQPILYPDIFDKRKSTINVITSTISSISDNSQSRIKLDNEEVLGNDLDSNETSLSITDIKTLQKELKLATLKLREDPILLIGPIPEDLLEKDEIPLTQSSESDFPSVPEAIRTLRSPLTNSQSNDKNSLPSSNTTHPSNLTDKKYFSKLKHSEYRSVTPSLSDLNFIEKEHVKKGININAFLTYPSSNLLQGRFMLHNLDKTKIISPFMKKVKLHARNIDEKNIAPKTLLLNDIAK